MESSIFMTTMTYLQSFRKQIFCVLFMRRNQTICESKIQHGPACRKVLGIAAWACTKRIRRRSFSAIVDLNSSRHARTCRLSQANVTIDLKSNYCSYYVVDVACAPLWSSGASLQLHALRLLRPNLQIWLQEQSTWTVLVGCCDSTLSCTPSVSKYKMF